MKKLSHGIIDGVLVLALLAAGEASAATKMLKSSAPTSTSITSIACGGTDASSYGVFTAENTYSSPYNMKQGRTGTITAISTAGATAAPVMQIAPLATGPWETVATFTNPPANGAISYSIPLNINFVRVGIPTGAYTAGSIYFCITVVSRSGEPVY